MQRTRRAFMIFGIVAMGLFAGSAIAQTAKDPNAVVYVTKASKHYHTHRECIALHNAKPENVQAIPLSEVGERTLCGICAHHKADKK